MNIWIIPPQKAMHSFFLGYAPFLPWNSGIMRHMETEKNNTPLVTVAVGGAAGDGIKEGGLHLSEIVQHIGCYVYMTPEYPSLIRGGHNYARLTYGDHPVHADHSMLDVIIATNAESVLLHRDGLKNDAVIFIDSPYAEHLKEISQNIVSLPMSEAAKEAGAPHAAGPSVGVGAYCYFAGLSREESEGIFGKVFGDILGGITMNVALALRGYDAAKASGLTPRLVFPIQNTDTQTGVLLEGNKAVALGFLSAGLEFFVGYPMTPASSILHFLAKESAKGKIKVIHPEDEITVINMALGIAYAGKRVAVSTATGGLALMQETFSLAGVSETPIALAISSRQGPATGAATRTSQGDLRFVISSGHGEFPRVVIAPGDPEEAFMAGQIALNFAWKFQTPAIVLLDKQLSESYQTSTVPSGNTEVTPHKKASGGEYLRYQYADDGVSPLAFPGTSNTKVKATSYEHDEFGIASDESDTVRAMQDKRWKKMEGIRSDARHFDTVKVYGDSSAKTAVLFWGSTKGPVLEAAAMIDTPLRLVQVLWMEPFPEEEVAKALDGADQIIDVEVNHNAQLAGLLREKTGIMCDEKILKYDARPFDPATLAKELQDKLKIS
ncbi:MAG: Pyruvate flavodoxin/ferredoxin oxidoreductase domain protein [Parcubacteria group bacterium GW2011_GWA2_47_7]|nr:MAG: Pyruvate flavodoxin/ferredoxin oxidoreductase domain protein [Parcubacteria group bacterium GW2011_GWA2_47_7]